MSTPIAKYKAYKEAARSWELRCGHESLRANELEAIRIEYLLMIGDANKLILNEAARISESRPNFADEVDHLRRQKAPPVALVKVLIKEFRAQLEETIKLGSEIAQLKREIESSQTQVVQQHSRRALLNNAGDEARNAVSQEQITELVTKISLLENEKGSLEADKHALKLELDEAKRRNENVTRAQDLMRQTQDTEMTRLRNSLRAQYDTECNRLRDSHNIDKRIVQQSLEQQHNKEKQLLEQNLREKHEDEKRELRATLFAKYEDEKSRIQTAHDTEKARIRANHDIEKSRMEATHDEEKRRLLTESSDLQNRLQALRTSHEEEKGRMRQEWDARKARLINTMQEARESYDIEKEDMEEKHEAAMKKMEDEYEADLDDMTEKHESEQKQLNARISQMENDHAAEQAKTKKDFEVKKQQLEQQTAQEEARLKASYEAKAAQLEVDHADDKMRLRKEVEAYSTALLARDDFKPMPDNDIKSRFLDLVQDVDALARLEWKANHAEWTDQVLRRLSQNQRLLKKQILQDSIWVLLHDFIFCSPFRIFGEEGQSLERQWSRNCGNLNGSSPVMALQNPEQTLTVPDTEADNVEYIWPKPGMETERWRYVTVKEARAALKQPTSEWDPRAKPKKGFKISIEALRSDFAAMLGDVVTLDKRNIQAIEKLTIKAANMWLEFGMQRCRLLVVFQGSNLNSAEAKIQAAEEDSLELVVVPELKRFGNSKGQELNRSEIVAGCEGEIVEVSTQRGKE